MSTKIYYAYRMPARLLTPTFLPSFRTHVFNAAAWLCRTALVAVPMKDVKKVWAETFRRTMSWRKFQDDVDVGEAARLRVVFASAREYSTSGLRDSHCIDCSLNLWLYHGRVYAIPYGEPWLWEHYALPAGVEDYCYWNSSDQPDNVSCQQWLARRDTWDKVCLNDWDGARLTHRIIEAGSGFGLLDVAKIIVGAKHCFFAVPHGRGTKQ